MGLFNFFGKSNNDSAPKPKSAVEINQAKSAMKEKLMASLTKSLTAHNFTKMEIKEVFDIIDLAEADIQNLKDSLMQIKMTSSDPTAAILKIKKERPRLSRVIFPYINYLNRPGCFCCCGCSDATTFEEDFGFVMYEYFLSMSII